MESFPKPTTPTDRYICQPWVDVWATEPLIPGSPLASSPGRRALGLPHHLQEPRIAIVHLLRRPTRIAQAVSSPTGRGRNGKLEVWGRIGPNFVGAFPVGAWLGFAQGTWNHIQDSLGGDSTMGKNVKQKSPDKQNQP